MSGARVVGILSRGLVELALVSDDVALRRWWRLGRWSRWAITAAHEILLAAAYRFRLLDVRDDELARAQAMPLKGLPQLPLNMRRSSGVSARARQLVSGFVSLPDGSRRDVSDISWRHDPFGDGPSSGKFGFHALDWVRELLEAHEKTGDPVYLETGKMFIERWITECLYTERNAYIWDDHITALRALLLCQAWSAFWPHEAKGSPFMARLLAAIRRHGERLVVSRFYRREHNHGVTQAYASFAIGLLFPTLPEAAGWRGLGERRLEAQISENVSAEGLHREHSPFYHFYVTRQFLDAALLAEAYGYRISSHFLERLTAMLATGAYLLKPNGRLPALGDTSASSSVAVHLADAGGWAGAETYVYSASQGREGRAPEPVSILLPDAGYAVLRSGWGGDEPFREARYLVARLGTQPTSHVHRDVLSFELYAYGEDLVVDSGGPFAYGHPLREQYFLSTAAHNTVVVDGRNQRVGQARVLVWDSSSLRDVLIAEHDSLPGVVHRRAIIFVRPDCILVLDRVVSRHRAHCSQLFHLSPALRVRLVGSTVIGEHDGDGPGVHVVAIAPEGLGVRMHHGAQNPVQGWVCRGHGQMVPTAVVEYEKHGTDVWFATLLAPRRGGVSRHVSAELEGAPLSGEARLRVTIDAAVHDIAISAGGHVQVGGSSA